MFFSGIAIATKLKIATRIHNIRTSVDDQNNQNDAYELSAKVDFLTVAKASLDPGNIGPFHQWLPENIWPNLLRGWRRSLRSKVDR